MIKNLLVISLLASASTGAFAQTPQSQRGGSPAEQQACAKDVSRYCRELMGGSDLQVLGCLKANRANLSKPCDKVLQDHNQ